MTESSTTDAAASTELQSRYGTPRRSASARSQRWMIIGALVLAFGAIVYFTVGNAVGQLTHNDVGYRIISDTEASVDFEVSKDQDATVQCMIHVLDNSYAVVGARVITIGPHEGSSPGDRSEYYRTEVRTESRGVTGVVDSCWDVD
ncbi:DUF4307 domain-containing protein [Nesterenkonia sp. AY15]|uniref:DUF4307 domain-containing protein n=1 Tax=Nesterenkonia sp. AY15 TaxID=2901139 RepID=UPI001F4D0500|nr:DUF4307 domain-containing protein [Nesterenkonia sp. AY15]MCH8571677.1 DUF4307 domain-containing protein [Nesterenkonia sp. AY15]